MFQKSATVKCVHPTDLKQENPQYLSVQLNMAINRIPDGQQCGLRPLKSVARRYPYTFCDGLAVFGDDVCPPGFALCGIKAHLTKADISGNFF